MQNGTPFKVQGSEFKAIQTRRAGTDAPYLCAKALKICLKDFDPWTADVLPPGAEWKNAECRMQNKEVQTGSWLEVRMRSADWGSRVWGTPTSLEDMDFPLKIEKIPM